MAKRKSKKLTPKKIEFYILEGESERNLLNYRYSENKVKKCKYLKDINLKDDIVSKNDLVEKFKSVVNNNVNNKENVVRIIIWLDIDKFKKRDDLLRNSKLINNEKGDIKIIFSKDNFEDVFPELPKNGIKPYKKQLKQMKDTKIVINNLSYDIDQLFNE